MIALFKIRMNQHCQMVVSGEYGQGKSSTAFVIAKWETRYIKNLIKWYIKNGLNRRYENISIEGYENLHFSVQDNIVISPEDPSSKYIYQPKRLSTVCVDDAYFFTTSGEANTIATRNIQKSITGNRKMNPTMIWIVPNIFKFPTLLLETQTIWIHKESQKVGDVLIPSRVIQLREKFSREKVEQYAKYPKAFKFLIKFHPSFICKIKFPKVKGKGWEKYLAKYDK